MDPHLKCYNCNSPYILEGKKPRLPLLLQCAHCYCSACLSGLVKHLQSDVIPCPECRVPTPLRPDVPLKYQLPISVYTVGAVIVNRMGLMVRESSNGAAAGVKGPGVEVQSGNNIIEKGNTTAIATSEEVIRSLECEECELKMADIKCDKCDALYCNSCFEVVHSVSKLLRAHKKIDINTTKRDDDSSVQNDVLKGQRLLELLRNARKTMELSLEKNRTNWDRTLTMAHTVVDKYHRKLDVEFSKLLDVAKLKQEEFENNLQLFRNEADRCEKDIEMLTAKASHLKKDKFEQDMKQALTRASECCNSLNKAAKLSLKMNVDSPRDIDMSSLLTFELHQEPTTIPIIREQSPAVSSQSTPTKALSPSSALSTPTKRLSPQIKSHLSSHSGTSSPRSGTVSRDASPYRFSPVPPSSIEDLRDSIDCIVTQVETPSEFWVVFEEDRNKLATLNKFLNKHCQKGTAEEALMQKGTICAVEFKKGEWGRGLIEKVMWTNPNHLVVFPIDDGGVPQMVLMSSARGIPKKWSSMPPLCHQCSLHDIEPVASSVSVVPRGWSINCTTYLRSVIQNQPGIKLKIISKQFCGETQTEVLMVDLFLSGGISVSNTLVSQGKAERSEAKLKEKLLTPRDLPIGPVPPPGTQIHVEIITASSPLNFHVLSSNGSDPALERISELISNFVNCGAVKVAPSRLVVGALVLAPYENEYYRAKILGIDKDSVSVHYVDYGNDSKVSSSSLYEMTKKLLKIPAVSYHCSINTDIKEWPEEICDEFYKLTENRPLVMTVVGGIKDTPTLLVDLHFSKTNENIREIIEGQISSVPSKKTLPTAPAKGTSGHPPPPGLPVIDRPPPPGLPPVNDYRGTTNHPPPPELPNVGYKGPVVIKNVQTPLEFHVVLAQHMATFDQIESSPPVIGPSTDPFLPKAGSYCHALFQSKYHRAMVRSVTPPSCMVYYIDYGNTETIPLTDLLPLPDALSMKPALAIPCRLHGVNPDASFDYSLCMDFYQVVFEKFAKAEIKDKVTDPAQLVISLTIDEDNVFKLCPGLLGAPTVVSPVTTPTVPPVMTTPTVPPPVAIPTVPPPVATPTMPPPVATPTILPPLPTSQSTQDSDSTAVDTPPPDYDVKATPPPPSGLPLYKYLDAVKPLKEEYKVMITYFDEDKRVLYGQPVEFAYSLEQVIESIEQMTKVPRPIASLSEVSPGQGCVALYCNEWYRATIKTISKETAQVYFIDFGNTAECSAHQILDKRAAQSVPGIAVAFSECKGLPRESFKSLIDKEVSIVQDVLLVENDTFENNASAES